MNLQIQELLEQAGLKHHNWITNESNINDGDFKYPRLEDYEKFAELIVRECIAQAVKEEERYDSLDERDCDYCSMAMANFQGVLAKHFGVEE